MKIILEGTSLYGITQSSQESDLTISLVSLRSDGVFEEATPPMKCKDAMGHMMMASKLGMEAGEIYGYTHEKIADLSGTHFYISASMYHIEAVRVLDNGIDVLNEFSDRMKVDRVEVLGYLEGPTLRNLSDTKVMEIMPLHKERLRNSKFPSIMLLLKLPIEYSYSVPIFSLFLSLLRASTLAEIYEDASMTKLDCLYEGKVCDYAGDENLDDFEGLRSLSKQIDLDILLPRYKDIFVDPITGINDNTYIRELNTIKERSGSHPASGAYIPISCKFIDLENTRSVSLSSSQNLGTLSSTGIYSISISLQSVSYRMGQCKRKFNGIHAGMKWSIAYIALKIERDTGISWKETYNSIITEGIQ